MHNFTVFVDGVNNDLSINLETNQCLEVYFLEDFSEIEICFQRTSNLAHGAALGKIPISFAPVAPPVAPQAPTSAGTPSNTPSNANTPGKTAASSAMTNTNAAGFVAITGILAL
eukprot:TRINITY_DN2466_c0_g1_i1.p2 TRINITY_DN2466_c0_g1~~TRINITY_DN2466_c0_g1_i1.p2  ORF type:complete len:114 (+),score=21.66 TRINITY_DN2466_c0_g1_i1:291-632(+)